MLNDVCHERGRLDYAPWNLQQWRSVMKRTLLSGVLSILLIISIAPMTSAAGPSVSKSILASDDGSTVILLKVSAGNRSIYGVTVSDPSGSIEDVSVPKGWCSIASDSEALFRTTSKPVKRGGSVTFRITSGDKDAKLGISFKDSKTAISGRKTI